MLIINLQPGESIDYALKKYKRKHRDAKIINQLRNIKYYTKPSVERREEVMKAEYINEKRQEKDSRSK